MCILENKWRKHFKEKGLISVLNVVNSPTKMKDENCWIYNSNMRIIMGSFNAIEAGSKVENKKNSEYILIKYE